MVPYGVEGTVKEIKSGDFTVIDTVCIIETAKGDREVQLMQKWPARKGRPFAPKIKTRSAYDNRAKSYRYILPSS